jgi:hypothetical protein
MTGSHCCDTLNGSTVDGAIVEGSIVDGCTMNNIPVGRRIVV